jgi:hypothetical protein
MLASQPSGWGPDYQAAESGLQCIGSDPTTSHSPSTYILFSVSSSSCGGDSVGSATYHLRM